MRLRAQAWQCMGPVSDASQGARCGDRPEPAYPPVQRRTLHEDELRSQCWRALQRVSRRTSWRRCSTACCTSCSTRAWTSNTKKRVNILKKRGRGSDGERVRLPSYMVKDALRKAPRSFTLGRATATLSTTSTSAPDARHFGPAPRACTSSTPTRGSAASSTALTGRGGARVRRSAQRRLRRVAGHRGGRGPRPGRHLRVRRDVRQHRQADRRLVLRAGGRQEIHEIAVAEAGGQAASSSGPTTFTTASRSRRSWQRPTPWTRRSSPRATACR